MSFYHVANGTFIIFIEVVQGIIGSGNIGATAAKLFANAGHEVAISNSRGPESLTSVVNSIGANVKAKSVEDAIKFGEVILLAIP